MRNLSIGAATASLLMALLSGCASSPGVMRGQSPEAYGQMPSQGNIEQVKYDYQASQAAQQRVQQQIAQRYAAAGAEQQPGGYQQANHQQYQQGYQQPYQQGYQSNDQGYCPPYGGNGGYGGDGSGRAMPCQHYKYRYVVPQGLNYPPQNAMPGVIQYPYYTVKGPDCFFHQ